MEVGKEVLCRCNKCKMNSAHIIEVMFQSKVLKVMCKTCKSSHAYVDLTVKKVTRAKSTKKKISAKDAKEFDPLTEAAGRKAKEYLMADRYELGDLIMHHKFGMGIVKEVTKDNILVNFKLEKKLLAHGYTC